MNDLFSSLNPKQKEAVEATEGPVLILAGPGSGKTKTLTHRIAHLIAKGVRPEHILAVTFTNKAAGEMRERVTQLLTEQSEGNDVGLPLIGTFHAICVRFLRENASRIGYSPRFSIYDRADQTGTIKRVMKELDIDPKILAPNRVINAISDAKDRLLTPDLFAGDGVGSFHTHISAIYERYQEVMRENNAFDFDDLIMRVVLLLREYPDVLERYQKRFPYIMVDEYQDTNEAQYELVRMLASVSRNICVVGDDSQAIYSWRNANVENILNFEHDWPSAVVIRLEQNYRSTKIIIQAATTLIHNNTSGFKKDLWTENPDGEPIIIKEAPNEYREAGFILNEIDSLVRSHNHALRDFVILYRTNAQSRAIEETFLRAGMPYKIVGGTKFYERAEVKDAIAFLRLLNNEDDKAARERLEALKVSTLVAKLTIRPRKKTEAVELLLQDIRKKYTENITLTNLLDYILERSSFEKLLRDESEKGEERWQNVQELRSVTQDYSSSPLIEALPKFLEDVTLMQEADNVEQQSDLVHFMTLHMAKGLEFPVVFIAGCEEGILPHANSMQSSKEFEEERRLMYVGLTRAKERAYLLFARRRMLWGSTSSNPPSSFLFELPQECIEFQPLSETDLVEEDDILRWD